MADDEVIKSVRLTPDEARLLDEQQISFADLVRETIEKKQKKLDNVDKKKKISQLIANGTYLIIGLSLVSGLSVQNNLFSILIVGGLATFFLLIGGINFYTTVKGEKLFARKPK